MSESLPEPAARRRSALGSVVRIVFLLLVVGAATVWVYRERHQMAAALARMSIWPVLVALLAAAVGAWCGVPAWRSLLSGLGSRLRLRDAQKIYLVGQLGKYIPGGVWTVLAQATMARRLKVPRARSGTTSLMNILLAIVSSSVIGGVLLLIFGRDVLGRYGWALLLVLPLLVLLHPAVLVTVGRWAGKITHRSVPLQRIPERNLLAATGWLTVSQFANGCHLYLLAASIGEHPPLLMVIGLFSFATAAGLVIVIAPAGAGPRELILVFGLSKYMDAGSALLVVLMSRLLMTVVDFAMAGLAAVGGRNPLEQQAHPETEGLA